MFCVNPINQAKEMFSLFTSRLCGWYLLRKSQLRSGRLLVLCLVDLL